MSERDERAFVRESAIQTVSFDQYLRPSSAFLGPKKERSFIRRICRRTLLRRWVQATNDQNLPTADRPETRNFKIFRGRNLPWTWSAADLRGGQLESAHATHTGISLLGYFSSTSQVCLALFLTRALRCGLNLQVCFHLAELTAAD